MPMNAAIPDTKPDPLLLEGDVHTKLSKCLKGIPGVVDPTKSNAVILLTNTSDHKVAIRQGILKGMLTSIVETAHVNFPDIHNISNVSWTREKLEAYVD